MPGEQLSPDGLFPSRHALQQARSFTGVSARWRRHKDLYAARPRIGTKKLKKLDYRRKRMQDLKIILSWPHLSTKAANRILMNGGQPILPRLADDPMLFPGRACPPSPRRLTSRTVSRMHVDRDASSPYRVADAIQILHADKEQSPICNSG